MGLFESAGENDVSFWSSGTSSTLILILFHFALGNDLVQGFLPIFEIVLVSHYFEDLIDGEDGARGQLDVLSDRQFRMADTLLVCPV